MNPKDFHCSTMNPISKPLPHNLNIKCSILRRTINPRPEQKISFCSASIRDIAEIEKIFIFPSEIHQKFMDFLLRVCIISADKIDMISGMNFFWCKHICTGHRIQRLDDLRFWEKSLNRFPERIRILESFEKRRRKTSREIERIREIDHEHVMKIIFITQSQRVECMPAIERIDDEISSFHCFRKRKEWNRGVSTMPERKTSLARLFLCTRDVSCPHRYAMIVREQTLGESPSDHASSENRNIHKNKNEKINTLMIGKIPK